jgi:hypothetical protein
MKAYYLNMVLDDTDNLVASYASLEELRTLWKRDGTDFLIQHGFKKDLSDSASWYPYFTREDEEGDIEEFSLSETQGGAA